jgi:hypothetical protein
VRAAQERTFIPKTPSEASPGDLGGFPRGRDAIRDVCVIVMANLVFYLLMGYRVTLHDE